MALEFGKSMQLGATSAKIARRVEQNLDASIGTTSTLHLEQIKDRKLNTRELDEVHVQALQRSIVAVGLIHPIVVDERNQLLAGGHRLAALQTLRTENVEAFQKRFALGIPVHVLGLDSSKAKDSAAALAIEIAENEQRRDYTNAELESLIERMKEAGYHAARGRPSAGQESLSSGLQVALGKSRATIVRILKRLEAESNPPPEPNRAEQTAKALTKIRKVHVDFLEDFGRTKIGKELREQMAAISDTIDKYFVE